jgi:hypothetical protein
MKYEESYQGRPIVVATEKGADGTWSYTAEVQDGRSTISITNGSNEVFTSEAAARQAAFSAAAATIDQGRTSRGKP